MRNATTIAMLVLTIAASACSGPQPEEFTRADGDAIRANAATLTSSFNAKQIDKIVALYADNSTFMPPNAPILRGREPLRSFFGDLTSRPGATLAMTVETVAGHGPLAYESGTYSLEYEGGKRDRGKYLRVHRKANDSWRTEYTMWSSDLPQPPAPPAR